MTLYITFRHWKVAKVGRTSTRISTSSKNDQLKEKKEHASIALKCLYSFYFIKKGEALQYFFEKLWQTVRRRVQMWRKSVLYTLINDGTAVKEIVECTVRGSPRAMK